MKTIIILLACIACLVGCNNEPYNQERKPVFTWGLQVVEVDSCQYVLYKDDGRSSVAMVHHNNCKYCKQRQEWIFGGNMNWADTASSTMRIDTTEGDIIWQRDDKKEWKQVMGAELQHNLK